MRVYRRHARPAYRVVRRYGYAPGYYGYAPRYYGYAPGWGGSGLSISFGAGSPYWW